MHIKYGVATSAVLPGLDLLDWVWHAVQLHAAATDNAGGLLRRGIKCDGMLLRTYLWRSHLSRPDAARFTIERVELELKKCGAQIIPWAQADDDKVARLIQLSFRKLSDSLRAKFIGIDNCLEKMKIRLVVASPSIQLYRLVAHSADFSSSPESSSSRGVSPLLSKKGSHIHNDLIMYC